MEPYDELLVLENNSTDGTPGFLRQVSASDQRVRVLTTGARSLGQALNIGVREARHELLARMDADDVSLLGRFQRQVDEFAADAELVLCGTQIRRFSTTVEASRSTSGFPLDHDAIVTGLRRGRHVLCHPSVMFRKAAALEVGGYREDGLSEDCDFFLRLSRTGRLSNVSELGLAYRYHSGSLNARQQVDVLVGMQYAAATYTQDRQAIPTFAEFRAAVLASRARRAHLGVQALSDRLYRSAQIRILSGRPTVLGALELLASGALRPGKALRRLLPSPPEPPHFRRPGPSSRRGGRRCSRDPNHESRRAIAEARRDYATRATHLTIRPEQGR
jgi:glycosyltransferase involved in cell wall biosynthesis